MDKNKLIKIIIQRSADGFSAYAPDIKGIYGMGDTPKEAQESILEYINLIKELNEDKNIPTALRGEYSLSYKYDLESFLNYYSKIFTNAALERITGINQKQIQHYSSGHRKPRKEQIKKIELALHKLGQELVALEL